MIVQPGGRSCPCGNHGCLEQYISEPAVLSRYRELSGRTTVSIDDLVWAYNQKETAALAVTMNLPPILPAESTTSGTFSLRNVSS